jgi:hypothetical protein
MNDSSPGGTVKVVVSMGALNEGIWATVAERLKGGQDFTLAWLWEWEDKTGAKIKTAVYWAGVGIFLLGVSRMIVGPPPGTHSS